MSNVAPEHGPIPFGHVGDGGPISATARGTRPAVPADAIGTAYDDPSQNGFQQFSDPGDSDNDMDSDSSMVDCDY